MCYFWWLSFFFFLDLDNSDNLEQKMIDLLADSKILIFCNLFWLGSISISISKFISEAIIIINKQMGNGSCHGDVLDK